MLSKSSKVTDLLCKGTRISTEVSLDPESMLVVTSQYGLWLCKVFQQVRNNNLSKSIA